MIPVNITKKEFDMKKLLAVAIATSFIAVGALATSSAMASVGDPIDPDMALHIHGMQHQVIAEVAARGGSTFYVPGHPLQGLGGTLRNQVIPASGILTYSVGPEAEGSFGGAYDVWVDTSHCHIHIDETGAGRIGYDYHGSLCTQAIQSITVSPFTWRGQDASATVVYHHVHLQTR